MKITDLDYKSIGIIGFGREGKAALGAIEKYCADTMVTIIDRNDECRVMNDELNVFWQLGEGYLHGLDQFDVLIKSPGVPPCDELDAAAEKITSGTQIFFDTVMEKGALIIGVTGSKGKSTTSSLIYSVLKEAGKDVHLVGNIGEPALNHLDDAHMNTIFVHELSSYQLMDMTVSPQIAVVTSFFPEHLDYHGSLEAYKDAKKQIARFQTPDHIVFYSNQSTDTADIAQESPGKKILYSINNAPVDLADTKLLGQHNLLNIAGAWKVAEHLGVSQDTATAAISSFTGLPHRLQSLGVHHGIEWVDDAISTTPESAIAALDALDDRVRYIILGGQDRGNDFTELGKRIADSSVEYVVLFPGSGERIRSAIQKAEARVQLFEVNTMRQAVDTVKSQQQSDSATKRLSNSVEVPVCLLSTASPSYNMYKNFEEKGKEFARCIVEE